MGLLTKQQLCQEMYERFLDPRFAEVDKQYEKQQMEGRDDEKGPCRAHETGKPEGDGKREIHQDGDNDEEEKYCQGSRREQADHLVNKIEFHVFRLQPQIVLQHLDELRDCLYVLVAGEHLSINYKL